MVNALVALSAYAGIGFWGFQYAYLETFSALARYDDEGTMMLRVSAFLKDPASYAAASGMYGPFYFLHKYAIYSLLGMPVSHDVNRLTTVVFWLLIAATGAVFVHRMTRSLLLAALTQLQLLCQLDSLSYEPGHPQELCLFLIVCAVLLASFANERRRGAAALMGIGAVAGALLLVKVNLGLYLVAPLALAVLLTMRPGPLARVALFAAILVALLVPPAIMWGHLEEPWALHYDALVTFAIASCLLVSQRNDARGTLGWYHVAAIGAATVLTMAGICAVLIAWGNSLTAIVDAVILRPLQLPGAFFKESGMTWKVVAGAVASLLAAMAYGFNEEKLQRSEWARVGLALGKLAYGCLLFYTIFRSGYGLLRYPIALPFVWLVLVPPGAGGDSFESRFPRLFLSFTAAFQALQAYPVYGSQSRWAALLVIPAAALCIADALPSAVELATGGRIDGRRLLAPSWRRTLAVLVSVGCLIAAYDYRVEMPALRARYEADTPLDLYGARRIRLTSSKVNSLRMLVANINVYCDGFVGMPGFASLYFWTTQPAPGILNNAWMVNPDDEEQRAIIARMETLFRPCVVYNQRTVRFWLQGRPVDSRAVLAVYIRENYKAAIRTGPYTILFKKGRPAPTSGRRRVPR